MSGKTIGWILFLIGILLLSLAATPYSRAATVALMILRIGILVLVSVLTLRERWRNRQTSARVDSGDRLLRRMRNWYYDDKKSR